MSERPLNTLHRARSHALAPYALGLLLSVIGPAAARADALGPAQPRTDCPRGARSEEMSGGHSAYAECVPNLAREDWPCVDARRVELVGLVLSRRHIGPAWDGRRGPMPAEMRAMGSDYVMVEGACEPPSDAPIVEAVASTGERTGAPPDAEGIPMGCRRVRAWIHDDTFACPRPAEPEPVEVVPSPTIAAPAIPATSVSTWGCSVHLGRDASGSLLAAIVSMIALRRARRRAARHQENAR